MPDKFLINVELRGAGIHPHAWRREDSRAEELFTAQYWTDHIEAADRAGIDIAFLPDAFALQSGDGVELGRIEAAAIAARAAAGTRSIGLVPTVTVTHTEPFHVSKQIASIDYASSGRAGWEVAVSQDADEATLFGRKGPQTVDELWNEADDAAEVVTRLWDSWEDDAEIRDASTGRFIDRDKLHYIDFEGDYFSVKGPSITPRPPQGQPIVVVRAEDDPSTAVAAKRADIVRISAPTIDDAAVVAARVRRAVVAEGRDPAEVHVVLDLEVHVSDTAAADVDQLNSWSPYVPDSVSFRGNAAELQELLDGLAASGVVDGVTLRPLALAQSVEAITTDVVPGLAWHDGATPRLRPGPLLRSRLGLARPENRYAVRRQAAQGASK
ncbi:LLM class flavin-dependent oxidoreductase [Rhodococcoides fascians]|uniref:LLM class flavin-dependent oxidoreductase n=1 Tax=Rhodococcoides fascians TaxID=1828 RepID=UPI00056A556D|nr:MULTISPECIES: LLM class flavin-dependent oxidoreductase [Rhodococcus]OZE99387.1 LLM class flavin-dependent oxidoreductase [Rhodococcus sp. 15-1189-1-1a]OZF13679.1 LLM class flavin-dependent oxidoreductase [Rhodococcus sp. 14-2686-1-2]